MRKVSDLIKRVNGMNQAIKWANKWVKWVIVFSERVNKVTKRKVSE